MDERDIKKTVMDIRLTDDMSERIINSCYRKMNTKKKKFFSLKKGVVIIAAVIALSVSAVASSKIGNFRDVLNWSGAVVGTEYENATEEIKVKAEIINNNIEISIKTENKAPYIYFEDIGITKMHIEDSNGKNIYEPEETVSALNDGTAHFLVDIKKFEDRDFNIVIEEFTGYAKAEQPLPVKGLWKINISE